MIKAIETQYAGYKFRSRLEARWAVAFDLLGIRWLYEHQGYDIDGQWYLPDFELPDENAFFEVKGPQEYDHAMLFRLSIAKERPVYMAFDTIPDVRHEQSYLNLVTLKGLQDARLIECSHCGRLHITETRCYGALSEYWAQCFDIAREENFRAPEGAKAESRRKTISTLPPDLRKGIFAQNWYQREKLLHLQAQGRG